VYSGSAPRMTTFSTLWSPLMMRLLSPKKKPRVPNVRDDLYVGCGLADKFCIVVFKILARSNAFRQSGRVRAEGKS